MLEVARDQGWEVRNVSDAAVAVQLGQLGYTPRDVETQFPLGPYRLDFAIPAERINIEADGWVHGNRDVRARDRERDRTVKGWGWVVVRIDADEDIAAQLRRHVPGRASIAAYGETLRRVDHLFKEYLHKLQRRGVTDPEAQLQHMRDALQMARTATMPPRAATQKEK